MSRLNTKRDKGAGSTPKKGGRVKTKTNYPKQGGRIKRV